jgi:hypothetical protein
MNKTKGTCCGECIDTLVPGRWCANCPCHQPVEEKDTPTPKWRQDFKQFNNGTIDPRILLQIISFIEEELARTQHQTTQKIIEEIEGMPTQKHNVITKHGQVALRDFILKDDTLAVLRATLPQEK